MSFVHKAIKVFSNTGNISEKPENYPCNDNSSEILRKMCDFLKDEKFCDVTLISRDGIKIKAHRSFLAASSEYFLKMFTVPLKEVKAAEVKLTQLDGQTLRMVINSMYSNIIQLQTDTVEDILKAGHLLQLKALKVACCDFMKNHLESSNCLGIVLFAEQYSYTTLYEDSIAFALENFIKVRHCKEFLLLEIDQLERLLTNDGLRVPSEEEVVRSVISWIKYDQVNREKHITQLIQCVRLQLIQPKSIANTIEEAFDSIEWRLGVLSAYKNHALQYSIHPDEGSKLRSLDDVFIAVSGWDNTKGVLNVGYYYSGSDDWIYTMWPGMPEQRYDFASIRVSDKLIIAGGRFQSGEVSKCVNCLDLRTLKWTKLHSMIAPRSSPKMVTLNGILYVFGGHTNQRLCFAEKLDSLQSDAWKAMPDTISGSSFSVYVERNKVHIEDRYNLYMYNPEDDTFVMTYPYNDDYTIGAVTVNVNKIDYLIKIYENRIRKLNIQADTYSDIEVNLEFDTEYAKFADQLVVYDQNKFKIYTESGLVPMPELRNLVGRVVLL